MSKALYMVPIVLDEGLSLEVDKDHPENLLLKSEDEIIDVFSMSRRIYTLFRLLHDYTNTQHYIYDHKEQRGYGTPILITPQVYMRMNSIGSYLVVEFIKPLFEGDEEILYLVKATATTRTLFEGISIALSLEEDKKLRLRYPGWFKEMVEVLSIIKL